MATVLRRAPGKHRAGRATGTRPRLPARGALPSIPATVVIRPEVLRTIAEASMASGRRETGGPLIGIVQPSWTRTTRELLVSILGTVAPVAPRSGSSWVNLGLTSDGERAASALRWWRAATGLDLLHLGDWHKHHSGIPEPSGGDRRTAEEMALRSTAPVWLVAVSVADRNTTEELEAEGHIAVLTRASALTNEVRFYRQVDGMGLVPVEVHTEGTAIPGIPPLPWHVADPARFAVEYRLLRAAGFAVSIDPARPDGRLGLTLRLTGNGDRPLTVLTGLRYPHEAPATLDHARRAKVTSGWSPERFLVDLAEEVTT